MQPNLQPLHLARENMIDHSTNQAENPPRVSRSLSGVRRLRSDESWIEVSSQPSSSSLSSTAADDANPRALGVQFDQHGRRRRRLARSGPSHPELQGRRISTAGGSSQEEYEESESESDRIMTSSNENMEQQLSDGINPQAAQHAETTSSSADDDDDENATALGIAIDAPVFTPPPNAFSHPTQAYTAHTRSLETRTSYFPTHRPSPHQRSTSHTHSYPSRGSRASHTPYNMISPAHQADHDAALRASLSTLLSCAAAARGLPKRDNTVASHRGSNTTAAGPSNRIEPSALRLIPRSAIPSASAHSRATEAADREEMDHDPPPPQLPPRRARSSTATTTTDTTTSSPAPSEKHKRKASASKERHHKPKKQRRATPATNNSSHATSSSGEVVYPTLLTWFVGAGVVVLFSAISFSAGYAIGREVGRVEAGRMASEEGVVCGREVGRGLRRGLRWSGIGVGGGSGGGGGLSIIRV